MQFFTKFFFFDIKKEQIFLKVFVISMRYFIQFFFLLLRNKLNSLKKKINST